MGFRFRRSVRILPGLKLNFSKSGTSLSLGGRGATINVGPKGTKATLGIPGTGLSYQTNLTNNNPANPTPSETRYNEPQSSGWSWVWAVIALVLLVLLFLK